MRVDRLKALLAGEGLTPNKALGQNFLIDAEALALLAASAAAGGMPVLEVGPGLGALTAALLDAGAPSVLAVEKDARLAALLPRLLPDARLTVCTGDFLRAELAALPRPFSAAGNLPYYVTTPIVERLFTLAPARMTLTVQREAAARFTAGPGERVYGPMAVTTRLCYTVALLCELPARCFYPQPEVDSCAATLCARPDAPFAPAALYRFLKRAFAARRKTLANALGNRALVTAALCRAGLSANARAEALTPEDWALLYPLLSGQTP